MTEHADPVADRPAALLAFEHEDNEREAAYRAEHPFGSPDPPVAVVEAFDDERRLAFAAMYERLTSEERLAESARLNATAADKPEITIDVWRDEQRRTTTSTWPIEDPEDWTDSDWRNARNSTVQNPAPSGAAEWTDEEIAETYRLNQRAQASIANTKHQVAASEAHWWHARVDAWCAHKSVQRGQEQRVAEECAVQALTRCTYLGGHPRFPQQATRCDASVVVGQWMQWGPPPGGHVDLEVLWAELTGLEVRSTDRPGERVTATRIALLGLFAWAAKKQRREAVLVVSATWGQAMLIVHGLDAVELEAALSPLVTCIGRSSARDYERFSAESRDAGPGSPAM
jgi:hypothetical protein